MSSKSVVSINQAVAAIRDRREEIPRKRSMLVGLSGIDGAGKGFLGKQIVMLLQRQDVNAVHINVDGWLNLPDKRFSQINPAEHFYRHAIRFDELFEQLILPLKQNRRHCVVTDFAEETATKYRRHLYRFFDVGVIVLEGIYLLQQAYRARFDLGIWIDCSFTTALERALRRGQENLPPAETVRAYETIYFPAQRIHFAKDNPRAAADMIINNDPLPGGKDGSPCNPGLSDSSLTWRAP